MPAYSPSLRLSIILTVFVMGIASLSVAIFTGETYQKISLNNQKQAISQHIQRDATEILEDLGKNLTKLGLSLQHEKTFRTIFYKQQNPEAQTIKISDPAQQGENNLDCWPENR